MMGHITKNWPRIAMLLSNSAIDAVSLYPTYRKPFDLIFRKTKKEGWLAQVDDFRTFLADLMSATQQSNLPVAIAI
jgi:hypothetical protein